MISKKIRSDLDWAAVKGSFVVDRIEGKGERVVRVSDFDATYAAVVAREKLLRTALRFLSTERDDGQSGTAPDLDHTEDELALAARELVRAVDALPEERQPVGWDDTCSTCDARIPVGQIFVTPGGNSMCVDCATEGED